MPKVFIPQMPARFDRDSKLWIPTINTSPAEEHGEIVELTPPAAGRLHTAPLVAAVRDGLRGATREDWLLAAGNPTIMAAAAIFFARQTGALRMLVWDRITRRYNPVEIEI